MNKLNELTLRQAIDGLKRRKFSAEELREAVLARIKEVEPKVQAFISVEKEKVNEENNKVKENGFLKGIPFAVKEVLSTKGIKTTASSNILGNYTPVYDATVVRKLREAGGLIIGKTNCDAFAFGASTENSGYFTTKNPWNLTKVPGGSSGGSAAAVGADECIFALGTDTGGSIRQPASFCNITGLKPTYGVCSRYGLLAMASSLDCPGPMAKTVDDCKIIFDLMKGGDEKDATSRDGKDIKNKKNKGRIKIGLPKEFFGEGIDEAVKEIVLRAAKKLEENGFSLKEISLPNTSSAIEVYYIVVPSEISSNMARYDGVRFGKSRLYFEDEVQRRVMLGAYCLSAGYFDQFYLKASKVRALILKDYFDVFQAVDIILCPVSPTPPFGIGEKAGDPLKMYSADILTAGANLAGIPGLALPAGFTKDNLPVGMQFLGPHYSEDLLFTVGKKYQNLTDWHKQKPQI